MEKRQKYFEEALSDFVHDAASGGAIRHLVDLGYTVEQMTQTLSYPTPKERIRKTAYRYMRESGLLLQEISDGEDARLVRLPVSHIGKVSRYLYEKIKENGEDCSYFSCPFGLWLRQNDGAGEDAEWLRSRLPYLNGREQDYIIGIPWENVMLYHRLNGRMKEIGKKLFLHMEPGCRYYFLKTGEIVEGLP